MAVRRRKPARRRSASSGNGLPGWAWLIIGALLALGLVLVAPQYLKPDSADGFFRAPSTAKPVANDAPNTSPPATPVPRPAADTAAHVAVQPDYDFYTVLPEPDTARSADAAELASPRAESAATTATAETPARRPETTPSPAVSTPPAATAARPVTAPTTTTAAASAARTPPAQPNAPTRGTAATPAGSSQTTLLQAGAFLSPADAEALKARIALLGLQARVESSAVDGQTVYRVRLGPWANARELAAAKQRLDEGGLPAREIRR